MLKRISLTSFAVLLLLMSFIPSSAAGKGMIGVNVLLNRDVSNQILSDLGRYGKVRDVIYELNAVTLQAK